VQPAQVLILKNKLKNNHMKENRQKLQISSKICSPVEAPLAVGKPFCQKQEQLTRAKDC
jgi:hypothetical protein